jgi:exosortase/archaeosortase family protein
MATFGFVLRALGWIAVLFGGMRLAWVQENLLVPSASLQHGLACALTGASRNAVVVDQSCTGSDAMALCLGAIFAFPATWRRRLVGAAVGLACILAVNTVRIGSLSLVVGDRELFHLLHIYVWPAVIVLVAAVYVYFWMGSAVAADAGGGSSRRIPATATAGSSTVLRFLAIAGSLVTLYYLLHDRWLSSALLGTLAAAVARTAALLMKAVGMEVTVTEQIVRTAHGAWIVTPECATTPLIPIYLAAVLTVRLGSVQRALAILATGPLFFALAVSRLLVLALPPVLIGSPIAAIHAFYQFLAGAGLVALTARRAHQRGWGWRLAAGLVGGGLAGALVAALDPRRFELGESIARSLHLGHGVVDGQGALALLPAFQVGLFVALWQAGGRRWRAGPVIRPLLALIASQIAILTTIGELATHMGVETPIVMIRAWALLVPPLLAWQWHPRTRAGDGPAGSPGYQGFWDRVGADFPDLGGAASTEQYLEGEQRLFRTGFPELEGLRLFKTDLWDEARNTRILQWAGEQGASTHGIDISTPTLLGAQREFRGCGQSFAGVVADVRAIPFRDGAFDAAYSMGTVEHFAETAEALAEIHRVVRPGGRAIIGVPNRHDPFLRPLLVAILYRLGLYGYGLEKSYSRAELRRMCERAGFEQVGESGLLFIPGWLRMLDLACWAWARPLARLTGLAVRPFAWMERRWPRLCRHGYLIAAFVRNPENFASRDPHPAGQAATFSQDVDREPR